MIDGMQSIVSLDPHPLMPALVDESAELKLDPMGM